MKKIYKILLAVLSGLLLAPAYFKWGSGFLMFIALVPLLIIEQDHYERKDENRTKNLFWYPVIALAIFNALTIWWVKYAHVLGMVVGIPLNTFVMTLPFIAFHYVKRNLGSRLGYFSLIVMWTAIEYLYLNVQVNFPWVLFGNAFFNDVAFVQWYEVTGIFGGTIWILIMNILITQLWLGFKKDRSFKANKVNISWILAFLIIPVLISVLRFYTYEEEKKPYEVVVLQPNIDPNLKFTDMPAAEQTAYLIDLARASVTAETDYIVAPETFIYGAWHSTIDHQPDVLKLKAFLSEFPNAKLIIGAMTFKRYLPNEEIPATAKPYQSGAAFYDSFNSAIQLDNSDNIPLYHKSRLVTGAEWMPSFKKFKKLQKFAIDLGGITRSHGTQEERETFISQQDSCKVGPVICWESIFGEFVTKYVKDADANLLFIITNDGWWRDTPGHRQHNSFAHLRAIETRRSIARSANTGISSLIDQRGVEIDRIGWWQRDYIKGTLNASDHKTFYVKHGDYLARISAFMAVIMILFAFVNARKKVKVKRK